MKTKLYIFLNIFIQFFSFQRCEYPQIKRTSNSNTCEDPRNTALVEQFFNLIFTEFQNTPPVCVCVQMCKEQATYCYPNGCLKRTEQKIETTTENQNRSPVNRIQYGTPKSVMFLVDDKQDFDEIFESPKPKLNHFSDKRQMPQVNDITYTQSPFKEFLKYKRMPKLEMRYNLREQIKHVNAAKLKRDNLDMLLSKWPMNTHFLKGQQLNRIYKKNNGISQTKFFISMIPDTESVAETPTFYKKFITKREDASSVNVEALYLYETDAANFSLETLIDNLIVGSLDKNNNDTNIDLKSEITHESFTTTENNTKTYLTKNHLNLRHAPTSNDIKLKESDFCVKNSSIKTIDTDDSMVSEKSDHNEYFQMMTTMSKKIDEQNNMTVKLIKHITADQKLALDKQNISITDKIILERTTEVVNKSKNKVSLNTPETMQTGLKTTSSLSNFDYTTTTKRLNVPELKPIKKGKRNRIVRKLF